MNNYSAKHYLKIMAVTFASLFATILALNILMDPYQIYGVPVKHRPLYLVDMSYLTKAVQLIRNKADTLLMGSSIVDAAFKLPGSETEIYEYDYFHERMNKLKAMLPSDVTIYNAGLRGGGINDVYNYLQHAYKNNPHIKHIILGVEWNFFTYARRAESTFPAVLPLNKTHVPFMFYVNNTLSWHVTSDSIFVLFYRIKKAIHYTYTISDNISFDPIDVLKDVGVSVKNTYVDVLAKIFHKYSAQSIIYHDIEKHLVHGQTQQELSSFLFSVWSVSGVKSTLDSVGPDSVLNPEAFATMRKIVEFAKSHHIKLDVYVSPQHAVYWEVANRYALQPYIDEWLKRLAMITPYWEFSDRIDFSSHIDNYFDTDALHFNPNAADIILPAIMRGNNKLSHGVTYVTTANVDSMIKQRHVLARQWLNQNHYLHDILMSKDFAKTREIKGDLDKVLTVEYKPQFKQYYMLKFMGKFVALPASEAPYDYRKLYLKQYGQVISGDSVAELMGKIK